MPSRRCPPGYGVRGEVILHPGEHLRQELISLSHELGREDRRLAILGEGNTSANCHDGTFLVKASGSQLGTIEESGFSR